MCAIFEAAPHCLVETQVGVIFLSSRLDPKTKTNWQRGRKKERKSSPHEQSLVHRLECSAELLEKLSSSCLSTGKRATHGSRRRRLIAFAPPNLSLGLPFNISFARLLIDLHEASRDSGVDRQLSSSHAMPSEGDGPTTNRRH